MDITAKICLGIIAVSILMIVVKKLISLGVRMLMGIFSIVFVLFAVPKINTFIINKVSEYGILENKLSEMVDQDIENKVKRDYKLETGIDLEEGPLLESIKAETFNYNPNLSDELNIALNAGFPQGINNTLLLNFSNFGTSTITATKFSDYVAKFFIIRISNLLSLLIAFEVSTRLFKYE